MYIKRKCDMNVKYHTKEVNKTDVNLFILHKKVNGHTVLKLARRREKPVI